MLNYLELGSIENKNLLVQYVKNIILTFSSFKTQTYHPQFDI